MPIELQVAKNNLDDRDRAMADVEDKWENGFTLVGATAIEDRLQDEVRKKTQKIYIQLIQLSL